MTSKTVTVNPTFRLDVNGKLFNNKESNLNVQDTITFNNLMSRLSIEKGYLPLFPNLGLKQHLHYLSFIESENVDRVIGDFESDVRNQMQQDCSIEYEVDKDNKHIKLEFNLEKLKYSLLYEFTNVNNSIKVINYSFVD